MAPPRDPISLLVHVWPPMLASLGTEAEVAGPGWSHEVKYDGHRALAAGVDGRVTLQSRRGLDQAAAFPAVVAALRDVKARSFVIDGEVVSLDRDGISRFDRLQRGEGTPLYVVFDLIWLNGRDLRDRPIADRRAALGRLVPDDHPTLQRAEVLPGGIDVALAEARRRGLEGVISKRLAAPYRGGRGRAWLKLKLRTAQEFAIVGWLPISSGAHAVGALVLAVREGRTFRCVGKVGTGFTDRVRGDLARLLGSLAVNAPTALDPPPDRGVRWSAPRLVAEIAFASWTRDGHLREPVFLGLRDDKRPEECVREGVP